MRITTLLSYYFYQYRAGLDLSEPIGNFFPPAQIFGVEKRFGGGAMHLYRFSLEQVLLGERLSILVGRSGMGDDFLTSPPRRHGGYTGCCGHGLADAGEILS
jgi:carbohydrate-selective porin OprB